MEQKYGISSFGVSGILRAFNSLVNKKDESPAVDNCTAKNL